MAVRGPVVVLVGRVHNFIVDLGASRGLHIICRGWLPLHHVITSLILFYRLFRGDVVYLEGRLLLPHVLCPMLRYVPFETYWLLKILEAVLVLCLYLINEEDPLLRSLFVYHVTRCLYR